MRKIAVIFAAALSSTLLLSSTASATGFRLPEQSATATGMASAFVGQADDVSAAWYNPAGLTRLDGTQIAAGIVPIYASLTHDTTAGTTDASDRTIHLPVYVYAAHKLNDRLSLGLSMNSPFGLSTDWADSSATRYVATFSKVVTLNINPNIAYKMSDNLSLALGIDYMTIRATLENMILLPGPTDANFRLNGDGDGWGLNAALHYKASDVLNLGLSYRSRIEADIDGTADVVAIAQSNPGGTKMTLPDIIHFGASYKTSENLILNADLEYTLWSTYDRLVVTSDTFLALTGGATDTLTYEYQWKDTWCLRFGGQYKVSDVLKLRAGILYDKNPVPEQWFDTRIPDADRLGLSVGTGYASGKITVDAAYMYLKFMDRTINESYADGVAVTPLTPTPTALNGDYNSEAHMASIMVGYKF
jgi:long-chain fatty acid transport protein